MPSPQPTQQGEYAPQRDLRPHPRHQGEYAPQKAQPAHTQLKGRGVPELAGPGAAAELAGLEAGLVLVGNKEELN